MQVFISVSEFSDPRLKFILILCLKIFKDESKNQDPEKTKTKKKNNRLEGVLEYLMSLKETLLWSNFFYQGYYLVWILYI